MGKRKPKETPWERRERLKQAYGTMVPPIQDRCSGLAISGHRDYRGEPADDAGSLSEYLFDREYCLAMAQQPDERLAEATAAKKARSGWSRIELWAPETFETVVASRRREPEPPAPMPTPEDAIATLSRKPWMRWFPEAERNALILTEACLLSYSEAAEIMGCSVGSVHTLLTRARGRFSKVREAFRKKVGKRL